MFNFWGTTISIFPYQSHHLYLTISAKGSNFPTSFLMNTWVLGVFSVLLYFLIVATLLGAKWFRCGFDFHFQEFKAILSIFFMLLDSFVYLLWRNAFFRFLNWLLFCWSSAFCMWKSSYLNTWSERLYFPHWTLLAFLLKKPFDYKHKGLFLFLPIL